jgi:hypothetical protein
MSPLKKEYNEFKNYNPELERMIGDMEDIAAYVHLFPGQDSYSLSKVDDLMDSALFDTLPVGNSLASTFELYVLSAGMFCAPFCALAAYLNGEIPGSV